MPVPLAIATQVRIEKPIWGCPAGTIFHRFPLKDIAIEKGEKVEVSYGHGWRPAGNIRNPDGSLLWLSHGFVLGDFPQFSKRRLWTPDLFTVIA